MARTFALIGVPSSAGAHWQSLTLRHVYPGETRQQLVGQRRGQDQQDMYESAQPEDHGDGTQEVVNVGSDVT